MIIASGCAPAPSAKKQPTVEESSVSQDVVVATGVPRLWIDDVTGAPGDGNQRLATELYRQMIATGLRFARVPAEADYFVSANIDVAVIDTRTELAEIIWRVSDRNGLEIGQIRQQNPVPRGMLHENWGDTAMLAAEGGLAGVLAVLDSLGHPRPAN